MGILLDPMADKLLVATAFITLVKFAPALVPAWIAVLIVSREFLVTGLCSVAVQEGMTLRVREIGKFKTVVQIVAVVSAILAHRWDTWQIGVLVIPVKWYAVAAIYFAGFWKQIDHASKDRRKSSVLNRGKSVSIG